MAPIIPGVIPFGLVMGTLAASSNLTILETFWFNLIVFAGASQLAALDLMNQDSPLIVVLLTGFFINLRFLIYSASLSVYFEKLSLSAKSFCSYLLTDQAFAVSVVRFEAELSLEEKLKFYLGAALVMALTWHCSVVVGYYFGNLAPQSWSLDFAVPLTFLALVIPSLKNRCTQVVAGTAFVVSANLFHLPFNLGLVMSVLISLTAGIIWMYWEEKYG